MPIKKIAIVHHMHTDFGYTDHQKRAMRLHTRYIDAAIDYVLASRDMPDGAKFAWTQEVTAPIAAWWGAASDADRARLACAVETGRFEITALPINVTAFMDEAQWAYMLRWLPEEMYRLFPARSIVQNDVNGMHTAGMRLAYERGVRNLWMGPNYYLGMPPLPAPDCFDWDIGDGKRIFVWLNASYNNGTFLFNRNWRQGPVPDSSDLCYRPPEAGDIWASDEASVRSAHELCMQNLALLEGAPEGACAQTDGFTKNRVSGGYGYETLPVSVTNQWRVDNDPPFYPITAFAAKWNALGLMPRLELTTASEAMDMMRQEAAKRPVYRGEWPDWWANGNASMPNELMYNRAAKRTLRSALSDVFGPLTNAQRAEADTILRDACMYDEHSFGSWCSVSKPYSFPARSAAAHKSCYAYQAFDAAKCLLADRTVEAVQGVKNRIIVYNPSVSELTARIRLPLNCLRGEYASVADETSGVRYPLHYEDGPANFLRPASENAFDEENVSRTFSDKCERQAVSFGPVTVKSNERISFLLLAAAAGEPAVPASEVQLRTDDGGWPIWVQFEQQTMPVIDGAVAGLVFVQADGFSPRWTLKDIFETDNDAARARLREQHLQQTEAVAAAYATVSHSNGEIVFTQRLQHPSIRYGKRILTIDLVGKKVCVEIRFDRKHGFEPEVIFARFVTPNAYGEVITSNAGGAFAPGIDQIPGSCMDFYAIDGWVWYGDTKGWLWNGRDSALVSFGATNVMARQKTIPRNSGELYARLFDNTWDTNFAGGTDGLMTFRFDMAADIEKADAHKAAEAMAAELVTVVRMGYSE